MKVLIIRNFPSYMDVENNTYNIQEVGLAKALVRRGHVCDIIFWTDKKEKNVVLSVDDKWKINVFYRQGKTKLKNTVYVDCKELFEKYDILQPCEYNQLQSWLLAKKYPNKTIIYHGPYYSKFNKKYNLMCRVFDFIFLRQYIKQKTKFIVKSDLAKKFLEKKGINKKNICTTGVGIDIQMLSNKTNQCEEYLYRKMNENKDELKILYIGRFEERRNIPFILNVLKEISLKNDRVRLYMVGTGKSEYLEKIWNMVDELQIRDKIIWQEKIEQKYLSEIYIMSDVFLLPTEYEIFGMVLLEAMYYQNVVLTTFNGGSSELIDNGKNGIIINDLNAEVWSKKILNIFLDRKNMDRMKQEASKTILSNYTWDKLAELFENQYRDML